MSKSCSLICCLVLVLAPAALCGATGDESAEASELENLRTPEYAVDVYFEKSRLKVVLKALAQTGKFELRLEGEGFDTELSIDWTEVTVIEALKRLETQYHLTYRVPKETTLIVKVKEAEATESKKEPT